MLDKKKSILYLRADICAQELKAGGSVAHTIGVIKGFCDEGYEVICALAPSISMVKSLPVRELINLKNPSVLSFLRWKLNCFLSTFIFTWQTIGLFKRYAIGCIYQRHTLLNCTGVLLSMLKKVPLILEYNGSEVWADENWSRKTIVSLHWLKRKVEEFNLCYAQYIIVVSEALQEELITRGIRADKILVNPNGVDTDLLDPDKLVQDRERIREQLGIEQKFVFGFIGTFSVWHGIEMLGMMIPAIIKQQPSAHFLLIGDGPLKESLYNTLTKNNVDPGCFTFAGLIPQDKARGYLAACDAFLSPTQPNADGSRFFGSPTKLFEYLSMGKPVIASDLEQLAEVIKPAITLSNDVGEVNQEVGFLAQPKNVQDFIHAACLLASYDEKKRATMGSNARQKAIAKHTWQHHVYNIISYVRELS